MKNIIIVLGISALALFQSCDIIKDPIIPFTGGYNSELYGAAPNFSNAEILGRNVLVEDFTAHQCGNCPPAAEIAASLYATFPSRVIPLAIHAGNLAVTNEAYPMDWTTEEGDVFWDQLDFKANPLGRVNRLGGSGNFLSPAEWASAVDDELINPTPLQLQLKTFWHANAKHLNIHVNGQFTGNLVGDCRLAVLFAESNLVGDQLYYGNTPEHVEDYIFDHMLRGSVTGATGLVVINDAISGDDFQSDFTFNWNPEWVFENSTIIVVVTDNSGSVVNCLSKHLVE